MSRTAAQDAIRIRKAKAASLVAAGSTQREIAEQLKISLAQVNRDLQELRQEWRAEALADIADHMSLDLHRIDQAIGGIWLRVIDGNLLAIDRLVTLIKMRARLFGYDPAMLSGFVSATDGPETSARQEQQLMSVEQWIHELTEVVGRPAADGKAASSVARGRGSRAGQSRAK